MKKNGLAPILIFGVVVFLIVLWLVPSFEDGDGGVACTEEARVCPDGTSVGRVGPDCEFEKCPSGDDGRFYCEASQRGVEACIEIYQPVCGWFDSEKIQCMTYPCAKTYSNSCFSCQNPDVLYWTDGGCPSS